MRLVTPIVCLLPCVVERGERERERLATRALSYVCLLVRVRCHRWGFSVGPHRALAFPRAFRRQLFALWTLPSTPPTCDSTCRALGYWGSEDNYLVTLLIEGRISLLTTGPAGLDFGLWAVCPGPPDNFSVFLFFWNEPLTRQHGLTRTGKRGCNPTWEVQGYEDVDLDHS